MLRTWRNSPRLFSDFNSLSFAGAMALVVFVILLIFMLVPAPFHCAGPDLPKVTHPVSMPGALREDALMVAVTRDGVVYFGADRVEADALGGKLEERLKNRDIERKVYVLADMRARWGSVRRVLDGVHSAGVLRVAFLVSERKS